MKNLRTLLGSLLIKLGMAILDTETRKMVRGMLLYHVPGALNESEKSEVRAAATVVRAHEKLNNFERKYVK